MTFKPKPSLFSLVWLIVVWSMFYAWVKYFFWGFYDWLFSPSLEKISWSILLWSMIAYIVGSFLYRFYWEKKIFAWSICFWLFCFIGALFFPQFSTSTFYLACVGMWFSYSLYVIGKNIVIWREMVADKQNISLIGAITTVSFIISMILGTIVGAKIGEGISALLIWWSMFTVLMVLAYVFTLRLKRETQHHSLTNLNLESFKKVCGKYLLYIFGLACFWEISVEVSQMAIRFSKDFFVNSNTQASLLLIYSSLWAIIGNIVSVRFWAKRTGAFIFFTLPLIVIISSFWWILEWAKASDTYIFIEIAAGLIGFLFWWAVNLAESHFLSLIWEDADKEYASSFYGFSIAAIWASIMYISEKALTSWLYTALSISLWVIMFLAMLWIIRTIINKDSVL